MVKGTHRRSGLAREHRMRKELFDDHAYAGADRGPREAARRWSASRPSSSPWARRRADADSFAELRRDVLELAREGVQLQRFKGLGEMNPEQLRETTMDPASRTLQQVAIDDAAALNTEQTFSDLMGDKVEPRKEFIERHARDVRFLDV